MRSSSISQQNRATLRPEKRFQIKVANVVFQNNNNAKVKTTRAWRKCQETRWEETRFFSEELLQHKKGLLISRALPALTVSCVIRNHE